MQNTSLEKQTCKAKTQNNSDHLSARDLQQAEDQKVPVNPLRQDEMQRTWLF